MLDCLIKVCVCTCVCVAEGGKSKSHMVKAGKLVTYLGEDILQAKLFGKGALIFGTGFLSLNCFSVTFSMISLI